jgi:hypothetical protein
MKSYLIRVVSGIVSLTTLAKSFGSLIFIVLKTEFVLKKAPTQGG